MKQTRKRLLSALSAFAITTTSLAFPVYADDNVLTNSDAYEEYDEITNDIETQELYTLDSPVILANEEYETSGTCGKNLTWNYDAKSKLLTIDGYGEMEDYGGRYGTPWTSFHKDIVKVILPAGITNIGSNAFCGCGNITEINIPDGVTCIGKYAFSECSKITELIIPDGVTYIGEMAFYYCESVPEINLPDSVTTIEKSAFWGCRSLTTFKIPSKITIIKDTTFDSCSNLESVIIPNGVTSIGAEVFTECRKLTSISIPKSVTTVGDDAFYNTPWLEAKRAENPLVIVNDIVVDGRKCIGDIVIPNNIVSISDYACEYNNELISVTFPEKLKSIGAYAFDECKNLTSAPLPNGLTVLRSGAFRYCTKLTEVDIPESVTEIQNSVFSDCTGITAVTIRNPYCNITSWSDVFPESAFIYCYDNSTAKAYAEEFSRKFVLLSGEPNVKLEYSYEITPLLSFSNRYFYIKTDDPDPSHFRFSDHDSAYSYENDEAFIKRTDSQFADVKYTDAETLRVNGGYIFYGGDTDGGDVSLQIYLDEWFDTGITYTLPRLYDTADYLIHTYAVHSDFWDNMDAVQAGFSSICLYGGSYIRGELYKPGTFYGVSNSPHIDQSFYIQTPYRRKDGESLFASAVYPFRYDSLGFPSIMATVAKRLDSSSSSLVSSTHHAVMNVTYNGETRQYGGSGKGNGQGITKDKITRRFTFDNYKENITLENIRKLLDEYADMNIPDDFSRTDQLTWSDVADTVGNGSWISIINNKSVWGGVSTGYSYLYKADDNNMYAEDDMGDGASMYMGNSMRYASDTWVDGRYVDSYERFVPGEKFEDHKTSNIILSDVTIPVLEYDCTSQYNYKNIKVSEVVCNVRYLYHKDENIWTADHNTMEITNSRIEDISAMVEQGLIPEKYLNALRLTYEDVVALDVDRNTNINPQQYYIYDQTAEPGTKVLSGDANNDGKISIADAVMLQKWLLCAGDLTCWHNVDLYKDERIDVFDLCLLKRMIIENL